MKEDTIAAVSTAPGESGIGIVRMSGPDSMDIADKIFRSKSGIKPKDARSFTIIYGNIQDPQNGMIIDEALLTVMRSPATYTKEDIVEINCHGGMVPIRRILTLCIENGARLALPGEFTKRAFLNGRIDLAQAEAVSDIIKAKTEESLKAAVGMLKGRFSKEINQINEEIKRCLALTELNIEFPEEQTESTDLNEIKKNLEGLCIRINRLIETAETGRILRDGIKTVIAGRPNTGKSSLLNELLDEERAIVTHIPGTTRDTIEESINIKGLPFILVDTAGIRETKDAVEIKGIEKSMESIEDAEITLFIVDGSESLTEEDSNVFAKIKKNIIVVLNKSDLAHTTRNSDIERAFGQQRIVTISTKTKEGIEELKTMLYDTVMSKGRQNTDNSIIITHVRHRNLLKKAESALLSSIDSMNRKMSEEFISLDLRAALDFLGEITGKTSTEDIINKIFSEFCIGK